MKRRPVAAIVFSGTSGAGPDWTSINELLQAMREARALDFEVFVPRRASLRAPSTSEVIGQPLVLPPWPVQLAEGAAVRLAAAWLGRPRASRPQVIHGLGPTAGRAAVKVARVLAARSVVWHGRLVSEGAPQAETLQTADEVWATDDAAARDVARFGVRPYRAILTPKSGAIALGPRPESPGRLLVAGPLSMSNDAVVQGVARYRRALEIRVLGPESEELSEAWPDVRLAFVDPLDPKARDEAYRWSSALLAPDPERFVAEVVRALLFGRPLLVPDNRRPARFSGRAGFGYAAGRPESFVDALSELWAAIDRGRFVPEELRTLGELDALESRAPELVLRTYALAAGRE